MIRICRNFAAVSGSILLAGGIALAQMPAGGAPQGGSPQSGSPSTPQSTAPSSAPSNTPSAMDQQQMQQAGNPSQDKMFVKEALEGGMMEVQAGQLAAQKASRDDVKQFGQKMVDDHTKMGEEMKPIAEQLNVKVPDSPSKKQQAMLAKLQGLSGDQFDKAYVKMMVKDHKKDLSDFKMESQNAQNPQLKELATKGAEIIQQHYEMIQQIDKSSGGSKSSQ